MTIVCRYIPNRTKKRYFSACDAARIAREVVKDQKATPEEVLACIAKGLGFTHISLSRQRVVESGVILKKDTVVGLVLILKKASVILLRRFPKIAKYVIPIIKGIDALVDAIDAIIDSPDQAKVDDAIDKDKCKCKDQPKEEGVKNGSKNNKR